MKTSRVEIEHSWFQSKHFLAFISKTVWLYDDYNNFWVIAIPTKECVRARYNHKKKMLCSETLKFDSVSSLFSRFRFFFRFPPSFVRIYTKTIPFFAHSLRSITVPMCAIMFMICVNATALSLIHKSTTEQLPNTQLPYTDYNRHTDLYC